MISMIEVMSIFEKYMMARIPGIDQYYNTGRNNLIEKLLIPFNNREPLPFYMLGLPFKSINDRDKVLGKIPDLGEEIMLKRFNDFNAEMKSVGYEPGVRVHIISDGYVFNDLMDVSDRTVQEYKERNEDMAKGSAVWIHDISQFYGTHMRMSEIRTKLEAQWGINDVELERRITFDLETNMKYKGMIRFAEGDLAIRPYNSRNQLHKDAKKLARNMMLRDAAYSDLVNSEFFKHAVKISMHPSENNGKKYGFQLIPGEPKNVTHSPWHSALSMDSKGNFMTIHKSVAIERGMELVYRDGQPYYFVNEMIETQTSLSL